MTSSFSRAGVELDLGVRRLGRRQHTSGEAFREKLAAVLGFRCNLQHFELGHRRQVSCRNESGQPILESRRRLRVKLLDKAACQLRLETYETFTSRYKLEAEGISIAMTDGASSLWKKSCKRKCIGTAALRWQLDYIKRRRGDACGDPGNQRPARIGMARAVFLPSLAVIRNFRTTEFRSTRLLRRYPQCDRWRIERSPILKEGVVIMAIPSF